MNTTRFALIAALGFSLAMAIPPRLDRRLTQADTLLPLTIASRTTHRENRRAWKAAPHAFQKKGREPSSGKLELLTGDT